MTKPSQTRDNKYYLDRLRNEHPTVYANLQAGKFKNSTEALIAAGLRKQRSGIELLKSAWAKATTAERDAFKTFIGCGTPAPAPIPAGIPTVSIVNIATPSGSLTSARPAIHSGGILSPGVKAHIRVAMARRGLAAGAVMGELGFKKLNPSLGLALNQGSRIKNPAVLDALVGWLKNNPE